MQKRIASSHSPRRFSQKRNPEDLPRLHSGRTPRPRSDVRKYNEMVLVARYARLGCPIRQRLRTLSTKQNPHAPNQSPVISHKRPARSATVSSHCNGSNHSTPQMRWLRCYPDNRRSWVLSRSRIHSLPHHHHGRRRRQTLFRTYLQMVRTSRPNDLRQRPPFYVALRQSLVCPVGD